MTSSSEGGPHACFSKTVKVNTTTYKVNNLTPNTKYEFTVISINDVSKLHFTNWKYAVHSKSAVSLYTQTKLIGPATIYPITISPTTISPTTISPTTTTRIKCKQGFKFNKNLDDCERTFCECNYGQPEFNTCSNSNPSKCKSCEYQFILENNKCKFCKGIYERKSNKCWTLNDMDGLNWKGVLDRKFNSLDLYKLKNITGLFYIQPNTFEDTGKKKIYLPDEFCREQLSETAASNRTTQCDSVKMVCEKIGNKTSIEFGSEINELINDEIEPMWPVLTKCSNQNS